MIKAILFDADDTLYRTKVFVKGIDMKVMKRISKKTRIPANQLYEEWRGIVKKVKRYKNPKVRYRNYSYTLLLEKHEVKNAARLGKKEYEFFNKKLIKKIKLMPDIKPVLKSLKKNYKIAITTGDNRKRVKRKLKKFALGKYFKTIISSTDVGSVKPDKRFYTLAAKRLGVKTRECLVVGNNYEDDIKPAKRLGLKTVMFRGKDGNYNIKNHKELLRILKSIEDSKKLG